MSAPASRRSRRTRPGSSDRAPRGLAILILLLVVALAGVAVAADTMLPTPRPASPAAVAIDQPTSGTWYCPVTGGSDATAILSVAAATEDPTTATVVRYVDGDPVRGEPREIDADGQYDVLLADGAAGDPVAVEWSGGPAVTSWRIEGEDSMGSTCESSAAPIWYFTGFDTSAESASTLHLFNPFDTPASARVVFGTPTGEVALVLTENLPVPAGEAIQVDLGEYEPEQADLAAIVEVQSGRLVAQGAVDLEPTENQPGPQGRDIIAGTTGAAELWGFADATDDENSSSWVSVLNPNDREAAIRLRVSDPLPDGAAILGETAVPPRGVVRIDLEDASAQPGFGVAIESVNDMPVVASRTSFVAEDAEGLAVSAGAQPAEWWAVAGGGAGDRDGAVMLYNPTSEPIDVSVDAGEDTPDGFADMTLAANERVPLALFHVDSERGSIPVRAQGSGPFLMGLRSTTPGDELRYWTTGAVPSWVWEGPRTRPYVERDPVLATRPLPQDATGVFAPDGTVPDPFDRVPDDIELAPLPRGPGAPDPDELPTEEPTEDDDAADDDEGDDAEDDDDEDDDADE